MPKPQLSCYDLFKKCYKNVVIQQQQYVETNTKTKTLTVNKAEGTSSEVYNIEH